MAIHPQSEIAQLAALLCDGELAPAQRARLEELVATSAEARRFLVEYLQLHGELLWDRASGAGTERHLAVAMCEEPREVGLRRRSWAWSWPAHWAACAAALALGLVLVGWLGVFLRQPGMPQAEALPVARLAACMWGQATSGMIALPVGTELSAGQPVELAAGLAEIHFASGARVILEGPAKFDLVSRGRLFLHQGRLSARVPAEAAGFAVAAAGLVIVDRGTEFGLLVEPDAPLELHVLAGCVDVQPDAGQGTVEPSGSWGKRLGAGQAVRVVQGPPGLRPHFQEIALREDRFVRTMPEPYSGSVARLRGTVASESGLMHHYPFEGHSAAQRLADPRGGLHLVEVVMAGGDGGGRLESPCRGFDPTTRAVRLSRGLAGGNFQGVGLQSETPLAAPGEMTVELLLRLNDQARLDDEAICAVVTIERPDGCAFLLATLDQGRLALRLAEGSGWQFGQPDPGTLPGQADFRLIPGDWYYLAATFRAEGGHTVVSVFSANISRGQRMLHPVLRNHAAPGAVPPGRLGIGKGFGEDGTHAFAWPGDLDEVALYGRVLDPATLQRHLDAILAGGTEDVAGTQK